MAINVEEYSNKIRFVYEQSIDHDPIHTPFPPSGFLLLENYSPEPRWIVKEVKVPIPCQRKGYGTGLINKAIEWLKNNGIENVMVYPTEESREFFIKCGFTGWDKGDGWLVMNLTLPLC